MSIAPGPAPLQPGTWEAPKWPPRAQYAAALLPGRGGAGKGRGVPGGPAAGHVPRVEPADDLTGALHRTGGERRPPVSDHPDLHADPPLVVDAGQTVPGRGRDRLSPRPAPPRSPAARLNRGSSRCPASSPPRGSSRCPASSPGPGSSPAPAPACGAAPSRPAASSRCLRPSPGPPPPSRAPRAGPPPSRIRCPSPAVLPRGPVPTPAPLISAPSAGRRPSRAPAGPDRGNELGQLTGERIPTRWQARPSSMRRSAASRADTVMGSACSPSQTARGAPPFRPPPSAAAGSR